MSHQLTQRTQILSLLAWLCLSPALAVAQVPEVISGPARALDADVLVIGNQRVILWAVDAPERTQFCLAKSARWGCYEASLRTFENLVGRGEVSCTLIGDPDPFNRRYGICESGGQVINAEMVRLGMALAFTEQADTYEDAQLEAIGAGVGLWQLDVEFQEPWVWRRTRTGGDAR